MADAIDELVERVTVDAYGDYEQLSAFWQWFEDEGRFPFPATVVGAEVEVLGVDFPETSAVASSPSAAETASHISCRWSTSSPPGRCQC